MPKEIQLTLLPEQVAQPEIIRREVSGKLKVPVERIAHVQWLKKSIDARQRQVKINLKVAAYLEGEPFQPKRYEKPSANVSEKPPIHIVGAGPAGLFAALELIELGYKPILIERGKDVKSRRRDLAKLNKEHVVNPESNYCFGEGGAGTYSDGKLYTRAKKRGDVQKVLEVFVAHGADEDILIEAHPHIGTNRLPAIIESMRETILNCGGEVHFEIKLTDLEIEAGTLKRIELNREQWIDVKVLILATGHSARDIFELLHSREISIEAKPFAIGVRVEHPQSFIDKSQYKQSERGPFLPPAAYSLVTQVDEIGVYSFCMCPGGIIAPCATGQEEVVTNGWSPSKRNNPFANSGIVVPVDENDWDAFVGEGPLAGLRFQQLVERNCWEAAGKSQKVPAQRLTDFVQGRQSVDLPPCSYLPGVASVRIDQVLPERISLKLKEAFKNFEKKMPGFLHPEAIVVAPESRTSSPVRIPRDRESFQHPEVTGFFPCGEGAGYAGGIVSAAMDGQKIAGKCVVQVARYKKTIG